MDAVPNLTLNDMSAPRSSSGSGVPMEETIPLSNELATASSLVTTLDITDRDGPTDEQNIARPEQRNRSLSRSPIRGRVHPPDIRNYWTRVRIEALERSVRDCQRHLQAANRIMANIDTLISAHGVCRNYDSFFVQRRPLNSRHTPWERLLAADPDDRERVEHPSPFDTRPE